ncbi:hypothetical protein NHF50_15185 [Flavobacterium sp. NRK F10]|uniref:hypothetical protein n=1 Tax=Flavobacterium sp. NRK F10 TaxID=2954931 RepID=UPI002090D51F|nr:hypothetical protein [Flavobacterium sp. NRK F10]MCO6176392.1 hypothetical protein [Flavobacterium sp. NRK F10]
MNLKFLAIIITPILFSSCALKPIKSEYSLLSSSSEPTLLNELDNGKVLIYNGAGLLNKIDDTSDLNIWINNRALGHLKANEYAMIYLLPGKYEFKIQHKDIAKINNVQIIDIDFNTKIICVKPTITSNTVSIENNIPVNFNKYKNILK